MATRQKPRVVETTTERSESVTWERRDAMAKLRQKRMDTLRKRGHKPAIDAYLDQRAAALVAAR
jgi:hypothetical protein